MARQQGFTDGQYEHFRDATYRFTCEGQDISRVCSECCVVLCAYVLCLEFHVFCLTTLTSLCTCVFASQFYHWQPLVEYKIPVISYLDTVCPFAVNPKSFFHQTAFWSTALHHGELFHKFTAVVLAHAIYEYAVSDISETSLDGMLPHWMPHHQEKAGERGGVSKRQFADWREYVRNASLGADLSVDAKTIR